MYNNQTEIPCISSSSCLCLVATDDDYYIDLSGPGGPEASGGGHEAQEEEEEGGDQVPPGVQSAAGVDWLSDQHAGGSRLRAAGQSSISDQPLPSVHVIGGGTWSEVGPALRHGVQVACALRAALAQEFGGALSASVGVATNKLLARLAGGDKAMPAHTLQDPLVVIGRSIFGV